MNRRTRIIFIIIVLIFFIVLGTIVYLRYIKNTEVGNEIKVNNFYNSEYLFNNNYIKEAEKIEKENNIIKRNKDSITIDYLGKQNEVIDLPSSAKNIYYSKLTEGCFELATIVKNNLYYASACVSDKNNNSFKKISNSTKSIYVLTTLLNKDYINTNPNTNFIIDTKDNLKYISYHNNTYGLFNNIEEKRPYLDYICANNTMSICNTLKVYITFQNELVFNNNLIKDENDKVLKIVDLFSTFSTSDTKSMDIESITYEKLNKNKYKFDIYLLDKNNYLYLLSIDNKSFKYLPVIKKVNNKKIKIIDYGKDKDGSINKVTITDIDGKVTNIFKTKYNTINLSTISERKSLTENLTK